MLYFDRLVQERCNSSALAIELRLSCTNSSISPYLLISPWGSNTLLRLTVHVYFQLNSYGEPFFIKSWISRMSTWRNPTVTHTYISFQMRSIWWVQDDKNILDYQNIHIRARTWYDLMYGHHHLAAVSLVITRQAGPNHCCHLVPSGWHDNWLSIKHIKVCQEMSIKVDELFSCWSHNHLDKI